MTYTFNRKTRLLLAATGLVLAGCEGLGDGNRPESFFIVGADDGPRELTQCLRSPLQVAGEFTNGAVGDFTSRANWTSSNPEVAQVSDGNLAFPGLDNAFLARGAVVPLSAGTATITAEFIGLSASIDVTVTELDSVAIEPAESTTGIGATRRLEVVGMLDGERLEISQFASWAFQEPDEAVAIIGQFNGDVTGVDAGTLTAVGTLDFCDLAATATTRIASVESVELRREFPDNTTLITGTTEFMRPFGLFANGDEQDLDGQVIFDSSDPDVARAGLFGGTPSLVAALTAGGPVDITATFGAETPEDSEEPDLSTGVTSAPLQITGVDSPLVDLGVAPQSPTVTFGDTLELTATGGFDTDGDGDADLSQEITRHVVWDAENLSEDETGILRAGVSNALIDAGTVAPRVNEAGQVIVTARFTEGDAEFEATTTITIEPDPDSADDSEAQR